MTRRRHGLVATAIVFATLGSGCSYFTPHSVNYTPYYHDYEQPDTETSKEKSRSCHHELFYIFRWGRSSIERAMSGLNGGDKKLAYVTVDQKLYSFLGLYGQRCTIVHGYFTTESENE